MTYLIAGLIAVLVFSGGLTSLLGQRPAWLTQTLRKGGGLALLVFAFFLVTKGNWEGALPVALAALMLGEWLPGVSKLFAARTGGGVEEVRTAFLSVTRTGAGEVTGGKFLAGRFTGRTFDSLRRDDLLLALDELDHSSAIFLELYLDSRHAGWREHRKADANGRGGRGVSNGITEKEAYEILGLQPGASEDMIRQAHRALMKKLHPDQGGSTYLATRVNQAKDVLLARHNRNS